MFIIIIICSTYNCKRGGTLTQEVSSITTYVIRLGTCSKQCLAVMWKTWSWFQETSAVHLVSATQAFE